MTSFKFVCNAKLFGGSGIEVVLVDGGIEMFALRAASTSSFASY
jgi:hypothetical protein